MLQQNNNRIKLSRSSRPVSVAVESIDEHGQVQSTQIAGEHPLTLYLDKRELVTLMTLGAEPEYLSLGYLRNQGFVDSADQLAQIQVDWETESVAITSRLLADSGQTLWDQEGNDIAKKMARRTVTTGCGQGTVFGNIMANLEKVQLPAQASLSQAQLLEILSLARNQESIYKVAGAVHGCALFNVMAAGNAKANTGTSTTNQPTQSLSPLSKPSVELLCFVEDVGRHNAVDAIAGWMWLQSPQTRQNLVFYTTGRLTSEMVIKAAQMGIAILVSRSGLTHMGYELAHKLGITLIGRCQGKHFLIFSGAHRFIAQPELVQMPRKGTLGVILAGGLGRRMESPLPKALVPFEGRAMIEHVIERIKPQVDLLVVNANHADPGFEALGLVLLKDRLEGFPGPFAGLQAAMHAYPRFEWFLMCPCDSPLLPLDLVERMQAQVRTTSSKVASVVCNGQTQPVFALVHHSRLASLDQFLQGGGHKLDRWYEQEAAVWIEFDEPHAFLNFNTQREILGYAAGR